MVQKDQDPHRVVAQIKAQRWSGGGNIAIEQSRSWRDRDREKAFGEAKKRRARTSDSSCRTKASNREKNRGHGVALPGTPTQQPHEPRLGVHHYHAQLPGAQEECRWGKTDLGTGINWCALARPKCFASEQGYIRKEQKRAVDHRSPCPDKLKHISVLSMGGRCHDDYSAINSALKRGA